MGCISILRLAKLLPMKRMEDQAENKADVQAGRTWSELVRGFKNDVAHLEDSNQEAVCEQISEFQCRISNPSAKTAVVVTADLAARTISYSYEPEDKKTAVPEQGILALRREGNSMNLYSADQQLSAGQVRRLILEPLQFQH